MGHSQPFHYPSEEPERNAYNVAFEELGFTWVWERHTFHQLLARSACPVERMTHYLQTHQPHLLKAYDTALLVSLIEGRKAMGMRAS